MRLLLLTRDLSPRDGPVSAWSFEMAQRLARRCDDFAALAIGSGAERPPGGGGFDVIAGRGTRGLAGVAARGFAAWRDRRFDVVIAADWVAGALGLAWRGRSGVRHVLALVHDAELERLAGREARPIGGVYRKARELLLARFDGVLATSVRAQALLDGLRVPCVIPIGRGCDPERFRPMPRGPLARGHGLLERRVLLSLAPLVPQRGIDRMLYAVSALGVRHPDLCYVVAGDGPERQRLELLAERLRIAHRVRFLGTIGATARPELFNLCDMYVHLWTGGERRVDTGGEQLLEARASGKPVVVTAAIAAEEGIDEQTGVSVPEDDSSALGEALSSLLDDPERARRLGERARERVIASATWDLAAERLIQAISRVVRRPRDARSDAPGGMRSAISRTGAALVDR